MYWGTLEVVSRISFWLAILSTIVSLFVFLSIRASRKENQNAVLLNRFVFYMSIVDFFSSLCLCFLEFPYWEQNMPQSVIDYLEDSPPVSFVVTPQYSDRWEFFLQLIWMIQSFAWFASFCFWFMIAIKLYLVLTTNSIDDTILSDPIIHGFCWTAAGLYAFSMFMNLKALDFDDWIVVDLESHTCVYIVAYICMAYLAFGVFLIFKICYYHDYSPMRQRMTLFVGLSLIIWIPAFIEFISNQLFFMLISISAMGSVNGIVWISSSGFEPCCGGNEDQPIGDRTYLFASGTSVVDPNSSNSSARNIVKFFDNVGKKIKRVVFATSNMNNEYFTVINKNEEDDGSATIAMRRTELSKSENAIKRQEKS